MKILPLIGLFIILFGCTQSPGAKISQVFDNETNFSSLANGTMTLNATSKLVRVNGSLFINSTDVTSYNDVPFVMAMMFLQQVSTL